MDESIFAKFNSMVDTEQLQKDIEDSNRPTERVEVPDGDYEVKITKLELGESKNGSPQCKVWFKVLTGDFKNQLIFMNQNVTRGFQIHLFNEFLTSLQSGLEIEFKDFVQYAYLLESVFKAIDGRKEFHLAYGTNEKNFHTYNILEVYDAQ